MACDCFRANSVGPVKPFQLIPEEAIPAGGADEFIQKLQAEGWSLLLESDLPSWRHVRGKTQQDLKVYSRPVAGSPLVLTRAEATVDLPAQELFDLMVSVEGYKLIDPDTNNHEDKPLEVLNWRDRAEVVYAKAKIPLPLCKDREYVVLNIIDHRHRLFVSKSIKRDDSPPGKDGRVRALNFFYLTTTDVGGGRSALRIAMFLDMGGRFPDCATNHVCEKLFFQDMYKRVWKYVVGRHNDNQALDSQPAKLQAAAAAS